jgi:shikimate 5-dehydrogenase
VQTSSAGMEHGEAAKINPLEGFAWHSSMYAYDIVYTPIMTPFLRAAEAAGCRIISGQAMFESQAERQAQLFRDHYTM